MVDDQTRAARNQALFREINERIEQIDEAHGVPQVELWEFICECADERCTAPMRMTHGEYEEIRRFATRFPVLPGHEAPQVERTVERHERYYVAEKYGEAGVYVVEHDPRRAQAAAPHPDADSTHTKPAASS